MLTCVASRKLLALDVYLHAYSGELAQRQPALPPVDNPSKLCTCRHTRASWLTLPTLLPVNIGPGRVPARISGRVGAAFTGIDSCRQADLDVYLHTCTSELALHLQALPPLDNHPPAVSCELVQCLLALPPVDNRPQLCACTHTRASLLTAYQRCLLSTTGHGRVPARIPGRTGAGL